MVMGDWDLGICFNQAQKQWPLEAVGCLVKRGTLGRLSLPSSCKESQLCSWAHSEIWNLRGGIAGLVGAWEPQGQSPGSRYSKSL